MTQVLIRGQPIRLSPSKSLGKGGEAEVWDIGGGIALKVYYDPKSSIFSGEPAAQHAAKVRIDQHQLKLPAFPKNLPERVVKPIDLATDASQRIVGYTMQLLANAELLRRYGQKSFRDLGVSNQTVLEIFRDLYGTVRQTHQCGVIIGDFNDLNVLVSGTKAYLIDADSFQYGNFPCTVFTARFVDPLKCDPKANHMELVRPHDAGSDWYAFCIMLMQSLLYVDPYGGVYRPKDSKKKVAHDARPLHRITIFNSDVRYPGMAIPYGVLPDSLLQHFHLVFEKDQRGEFPLGMIENMRWTTCAQCGMTHARSKCPSCSLAAPAAIQEIRRGKAIFTRVFRTSGQILFATSQGGDLRWIYHENNTFKRENSVVGPGTLDPTMRFRIQGERTLIAQSGRVFTLSPGVAPVQQPVDSFGSLPVFDANELSRFWATNGLLMRDGIAGPETIGQVLANQTLFWVGSTFGFGFYRAGGISIAFVFDGKAHGINDSVKLPAIKGKLVDSSAIFTSQRCWFFLATQESGLTKHTCHVISRQGNVEATQEAQEGDGSWLGTIRGKYATGEYLFAATDDGIVRVQLQNSAIDNITTFPDTEPFIKSGQYLFGAPGGLHVVNAHEIHLLKLA